jgi:hypothetical protein
VVQGVVQSFSTGSYLDDTPCWTSVCVARRQRRGATVLRKPRRSVTSWKGSALRRVERVFEATARGNPTSWIPRTASVSVGCVSGHPGTERVKPERRAAESSCWRVRRRTNHCWVLSIRCRYTINGKLPDQLA